MDQQAYLTDVLKALETILTSPEPLVPQYLVAQNENQIEKDLPVLPRHIQPPFRIPILDQPLSIAPVDDTPGVPTQPYLQESTPLSKLTTHLASTILPYLNLSSLSPNYYGFVTGGATPAALLADFLTSLFDQNVQVHLPKETLATVVEEVALNLLVDLFRLPMEQWGIGRKDPNGGGTFTTGATASNVLGLALGREFVVRKALERKGESDASSLSCGECGLAELLIQAGAKKIQVLSTLPHSSIAKAASIVGIGRRNVISIAMPHDPLQIDMARLKQEASQPDVLNILAVSAGEVNTGRFATNSLEQWTSIRQLCDDHGIWIHVDGAFGLFGRLFNEHDKDHVAEYQHIIDGVKGIELADSITGDCHKLLNVPYDSGVFFTRHKHLLEDVFRNGNAAYLTSGITASFSLANDATQSPLNIGIENSRRFRALPVYATLTTYGRPGYIDMLKRQIGLARRVTKWFLRDERFEVLPTRTATSSHETEAEAEEEDILAKTFMIVLFRVRNNERMKTFVQKVNNTGKMYFTGTVWEGKPAARIAVSNWMVDVQRDWELIEKVLDECAGRG